MYVSLKILLLYKKQGSGAGYSLFSRLTFWETSTSVVNHGDINHVLHENCCFTWLERLKIKGRSTWLERGQTSSLALLNSKGWRERANPPPANIEPALKVH